MGPDVSALQDQLRELGFDPGATDGDFGERTEAAVIAFQRSKGLQDDGIVGPRTAEALGLSAPAEIPSVIPGITVEIVSQMFPPATRGGTSSGTFRSCCKGWSAPISEFRSTSNTSEGGHPFDLYDTKLGNQGPPDGERFRGRGFIQLTGRKNYQRHGAAIRLGDRLGLGRFTGAYRTGDRLIPEEV